MGELERAHLQRARRRLAPLGFHPAPVRMRHVRIVHAPWLFRVPGFRRYHGYEAFRQIFIKRPLGDTSDDLIVHELCHVWQEQHGALRMWLSYLYLGYRDNPYEVEARRAVAESR